MGFLSGLRVIGISRPSRKRGFFSLKVAKFQLRRVLTIP